MTELLGAPPAVDHERVTGHIARFVGSKKADRIRDILGGAALSERDERAHLVVVYRDATPAHVWHAGAENRLRVRAQLRWNGAGTYAVHRDAARRIDHGHLAGQADDRMLRRDVRRTAPRAVQ